MGLAGVFWGGQSKVHSGPRGILPRKRPFRRSDANQAGRPPGQSSYGGSCPKQASKQARQAHAASASREGRPFLPLFLFLGSLSLRGPPSHNPAARKLLLRASRAIAVPDLRQDCAVHRPHCRRGRRTGRTSTATAAAYLLLLRDSRNDYLTEIVEPTGAQPRQRSRLQPC